MQLRPSAIKARDADPLCITSQAGSEYLKFWTYSKAVMKGNRRSLSVRLARKLVRHTWPCNVWIWKVDVNRFRTAAT